MDAIVPSPHEVRIVSRLQQDVAHDDAVGIGSDGNLEKTGSLLRRFQVTRLDSQSGKIRLQSRSSLRQKRSCSLCKSGPHAPLEGLIARPALKHMKLP